MHDTIQLRRACLADEDISRYFRGVFGGDKLDLNGLVKDMQSTWAIILNTDPISKRGQHWVAVVKRPGREHCLFFDSYSHRPWIAIRCYGAVYAGVVITQKIINKILAPCAVIIVYFFKNYFLEPND